MIKFNYTNNKVETRMSSANSSTLMHEPYQYVNYDPDANKNNIYARKLNRALPGTRDRFVSNPFTKIM
jgi:hypothetical protein